MEIFVLVVTPDQNEIRFERVERRAHLANFVGHLFRVLMGERSSFIAAPLAAHALRPACRRAVFLRQARILQQALQ